MVVLAGAALVLAGVGIYFLVGRGGSPVPVPPVGPDSMEPPGGAFPADDLLLPEVGRMLPGTLLYRRGKHAEAEEELESYLAVGEPEEVLQARYVLGMAKARLGRAEDARGILGKLIEDHRATPFAASALVALAGLETGPEAKTLAASHLDAAWMSHPLTPGGQRAGMIRGDELYAAFAGEGSEQHGEWERIRDAYSAALGGLRDSPVRPRVVKRLRRLNEYLVFNPRVKFSDAVFVTVDPGETLSEISLRLDSTSGFIVRVNRLTSTTIHPGQNLKIVGGRPSIIVDKRHLRLTLLLSDRFLREYPAGIGPGELTPPGRFTIGSRIENPNWYRRGKPALEFGDPKNILGSRWLGFRQSGPGMGIGIHGSIEGEGVGERASAGCIRMHNRDVEELFDLVPSGTRVLVIE